MEDRLPTLEEIKEAAILIQGSVARTPLIRLYDVDSPYEIYLKLENLQPTGAFKIRGAVNAIKHMSQQQLELGILTPSTGNMALGAALKAKELGIPCTVVVPDVAPEVKIQKLLKLGARVVRVTIDEWWEVLLTRSFSGATGEAFIHPCDHLVSAGAGTIGLEIFEDLPDVDAIVIPWGGGGMTCGVGAAIKALKPSCRIYTAEVTGAAPFSTSFQAGEYQEIVPVKSFVDGIGSKRVFPSMFKKALQVVDGALEASVTEVSAALKLVAEHNHAIIEGAGACPIACALKGSLDARKVVCIVSGGNINTQTLCEILGRREE